MSVFNDGWPKDEIFDKLDNGQEIKGEEALAYICSVFSNATKNNYEPEDLFDRVSYEFLDKYIKIKKD